MANIVDYLPFAASGGANVDAQNAYNGSGYQTSGFQNGIAQPAQVNKVLRQCSMVASAIANFIATVLGINVIDDGNLANLTANVTKAIRYGSHSILAVPYNAAAIFDASLSDAFETTLLGDMTPSLVNTAPGQPLTFIIHQDAVGGRAFNSPANLPMADISPNVNATSVQRFMVGVNGTIYAASPMESGAVIA